MRRWSGIVTHHTAGRADKTVDELRQEHVTRRGFRDVGYHYVVRRGPAGWVADLGRPTILPGAHCPGLNRTHLGVAVGGNYELDDLPEEAIEVLAQLLAELVLEHGLHPRSDIIPHHHHNHSTLCPGRHILEHWLELIDSVVARIPIDGP
jgi:hypothetical protein